MAKSALEVFRDHVRYTGDGLPNAPVGHPLPVGDTASGVWNPGKSEIRDLLVAIEAAVGSPSAIYSLLAGKADEATVQSQISSLYAALDAAKSAALSGTRPAGDWDASTGAFPAVSISGGVYYVAVAGVVGGEDFEVGDRLIALRDNASTTVYAGHWAHERLSGAAVDALAQVAALAATPLLAAADAAEARAVLGLAPARVGFGTYGAAVVNALDTAPTAHFLYATSAGDLVLDVAGISPYAEYVFVNGGYRSSRLWLDSGADVYFRGAGIAENSASVTRVLVPAGSAARIVRLAGNRIQISLSESLSYTGAATNGAWSYSYRRMADGTIDLTYVHATSISASADTTISVLPTSLDVSAARVVSVAVGPKFDGSPPPDLLPQITKLGATNGLAASQFTIRNPNAAALSHPITVRLGGITEV